MIYYFIMQCHTIEQYNFTIIKAVVNFNLIILVGQLFHLPGIVHFGVC